MSSPPTDEWESLGKILELSLKDHEDVASRLAIKPKFFYHIHLRYECGHEEDLGPTEIERDEDVEWLPYLVSDDNYPCPNCRGALSRAPVGCSEAFPRPVPSLTSSQLLIGSDLVDLNPQGRGKEPRNATTDPSLSTMSLVLRTLTKLSNERSGRSGNRRG